MSPKSEHRLSADGTTINADLTKETDGHATPLETAASPPTTSNSEAKNHNQPSDAAAAAAAAAAAFFLARLIPPRLSPIC
ncbi:hypothetical protein NLG97_g6038 [Lecanicillium saksenae]|uniref:Uncharacterized protein n=1 Tax=Lecanicillium saksenae TaxID=468837 RepID=A0ACC1QUL5_9HYPO|nr:hypothetical protein NLG97_g6038 [Lecanicillium saksenae]